MNKPGPLASRLRAWRRLFSRYFRSEEIRWRLLVVTGRYASHIAIVGVVITAAILAGGRAAFQHIENPSLPAAAAETQAESGDPENTGAYAILNIGGVPPPGGKGGSAQYSPQVFQSYVSINNEDGGVFSRQVVFKTAQKSTARTGIITYTVQAGDTIEAIAARFGLLPTTIIWSNDEAEEAPDRLRIGQVLNILPSNGIWYTVQDGDTIDSIAEKFKAQAQDIVTHPLNNLSEGANITVGSKLVIPNGVKPYVPPPAQEDNTPTYTASGSAYTGPAVGAAGGGTFIWPTNGYISQGFWWAHRALDIANAVGIPIAAADSGYVSFAGWDNTGYGYMIMLNHGNGFSTVYAHLSYYYVDPGQAVARGQTIGAMGSTGRSTGPHLHFEIRYGGATQNPLFYLP